MIREDLLSDKTMQERRRFESRSNHETEESSHMSIFQQVTSILTLQTRETQRTSGWLVGLHP